MTLRKFGMWGPRMVFYSIVSLDFAAFEGNHSLYNMETGFCLAHYITWKPKTQKYPRQHIVGGKVFDVFDLVLMVPLWRAKKYFCHCLCHPIVTTNLVLDTKFDVW
jgi:hypothetical protein